MRMDGPAVSWLVACCATTLTACTIETTTTPAPDASASAGPDTSVGAPPDASAGAGSDTSVVAPPDASAGTGPDASADTDASAGSQPDAAAGVNADAASVDSGADADDGDAGSSTSIATQALTTNMAGKAALDDGAQISVPSGAVPLNDQGQGTIVNFSVERTTATAAPPTGVTAGSAVYKFGPSNLTFAMPVQLTLPVSGSPSADSVRMYRIDPSTGTPIRYSTVYDSSTKMAVAQTFELSEWFIGLGPTATSTADGAFNITNTSSTNWINVCVASAQLTYPDQQADVPSDPISAAPVGTVGWSSSVNWYLPQGTYTLCVESEAQGTVSSSPGQPQYIMVPNQAILSPWTASSPQTTDLSYGDLPNAQSGACTCNPQTTRPNQIFFEWRHRWSVQPTYRADGICDVRVLFRIAHIRLPLLQQWCVAWNHCPDVE